MQTAPTLDSVGLHPDNFQTHFFGGEFNLRLSAFDGNEVHTLITFIVAGGCTPWHHQ